MDEVKIIRASTLRALYDNPWPFEALMFTVLSPDICDDDVRAKAESGSWCSST